MLLFPCLDQDDEDLIIIHDALGFGECHLGIGVWFMYPFACRVLRKRERLNIGFVEVQELDCIFKCLTSFSRVSVC
jgi:hypothetical protein